MSGETNRREFMKATARTAAGVWLGGQAIAADNSERISESVTMSEPDSSSATSEQQQVLLAPPDKQPPNLKVLEPVKRKVGWAIVGLGELALEEIMPAFRAAKLSEPVALVSDHPEKARKVAEVYGVDPQSIYDYQNYDRLQENNRVEVIYIVLPNSMHAEYTIRGFKAGKHVLCEKPMAVTVNEGEQMIAAARQADKKLMIGYRLHYEPFNQKVMELCRQQAIGTLKTFSASNCQDVKAPNIRLSKPLGGGPVGDVGIYCINAARYVTGEEPVEVTAFAHQPADDPRFREVPESVIFTLRYPSGVLAHCECGFGSARSERYRAVGAKGFIELDPAFSYQGQRLFVKQGSADSSDDQKNELRLKPVNHFAAEMDHFSECVLTGKTPRTPGELGVADLRIIAAIHEAMSTNKATR
jgi:predicted dehydrogenase